MEKTQKNRVCSRCGDCCRQFIVRYPFEYPRFSGWPVLYLSLHEGIDAQVEDGPSGPEMVVQIKKPCSMLVEHDDGTTSCKIQDIKPQVCKDWFPEGLRQFSELPRCSIMEPRDDELDKIEADKYAYRNIPPLFEKLYKEIDEQGEAKEILAPWKPSK